MATIVQTLETALGRRLSRREQQRWAGWHRQGAALRLRPLWVLEAADPATMNRVRQRKLVRCRLRESLSPTRAVVAPHDAAALVQHLRTLAYMVALPPTAQEVVATEPNRALDPLTPDLIWLLLRLYRGLGELAKLPLQVDFAAEQQLRAQLSPTRLLAAETMAEAMLAQIHDTIAGYWHIPPWQRPITESDHRPAIDAAMAQGHDLDITYWSSSSGTTTRRVTPYFVEEQRGVAYLHGYCHLREQERIFRIDRIERLQPIRP